MRWLKGLKKWLLLLPVTLVLGGTFAYGLPLLKYAWSYHAFRASRRELREPGSRVLVIAPHPDDETLGAAGVIQRARQEGNPVKVVVVTSGDHFRKAAWLVTGKRVVGPAEFALLGRVREKECLAALSKLGVNRSQVIFLRYHDGSLGLMWKQYQKRKLPGAVQGQRLVGSLRIILGGFAPTDIYYPYQGDMHPDHRAVAYFVQTALKPSTRGIRQHLYLVHYRGNSWPYFPRLRRFIPLIPPYGMIGHGLNWEVFQLRQGEVRTKGLAVEQYRSQLMATGGRYRVFVRPQEIFVAPLCLGLPVDLPGLWKEVNQKHTG